jgi:hypothetical protein
MTEISDVTLAAGSTPPCPGLAPWLNLSSTIFTWLAAATLAKVSAEKVPSWLRQPK